MDWRERLQGVRGVHAFRCENCDLRFFGRRPTREASLRERWPAPWLLAVFLIPLLAAAGWFVWADGSGPTPPAEPESRSMTAPAGGDMPALPTTTAATAALPTTTTTTAPAPPAAAPSSAPAPRAAAKTAKTARKHRPAAKRVVSKRRKALAAKPRPYTVQLGAFAQAARARRLADRLRRRGLKARTVRVKNPDGRTWFKVWVGRYATRNQAARAGRRLKKKAGLNYMVTRATGR